MLERRGGGRRNSGKIGGNNPKSLAHQGTDNPLVTPTARDYPDPQCHRHRHRRCFIVNYIGLNNMKYDELIQD